MRKIAILGASGRMGEALFSTLKEFTSLSLQAAFVSHGSGKLNANTPIDGIRYSILSKEALVGLDALIDFSTPSASLVAAKLCSDLSISHLLATTGFTEGEIKTVQQCSKNNRLLIAPNTSLGVSVLAEIAVMAQKMLGKDFDIEISEIHHREKRDIPSGTAKLLAERLLEQGDLNARIHREGKRGQAELGISSLRGGQVFGEHTIYFLGNGERIELTHRAESRLIFARGAYVLLEKLFQKPVGCYRTKDLLVAD